MTYPAHRSRVRGASRSPLTRLVSLAMSATAISSLIEIAPRTTRSEGIQPCAALKPAPPPTMTRWLVSHRRVW
jgi:hypothetical protein